MDRVSLVALMPLKYGGVELSRGEAFSATAKHAKVLKAIKRAKDAPVVAESSKALTYDTTAAAPEPTSKPADSPDKRTYRRKDMTARS